MAHQYGPPQMVARPWTETIEHLDFAYEAPSLGGSDIPGWQPARIDARLLYRRDLRRPDDWWVAVLEGPDRSGGLLELEEPRPQWEDHASFAALNDALRAMAARWAQRWRSGNSVTINTPETISDGAGRTLGRIRWSEHSYASPAHGAAAPRLPLYLNAD